MLKEMDEAQRRKSNKKSMIACLHFRAKETKSYAMDVIGSVPLGMDPE